MASIKHLLCPVCNSNELKTLLHSKDYTVSGQTFDIAICSSCETGITQNAPDFNEIGLYYKSADYISHSNTKKGFINQLYHIARSWMLVSKRNLVEKVTGKNTGKVLDIGCGTGYFLNTMQEKKWLCVGIEADIEAREFAIKNFGLEIYAPDKLATVPAKSFDVITLWHVLEHVHDLKGYCQLMERALTKEGALIIAVPNYKTYDAEHYGEQWAAWDVPRHLWHFTPTSMQKLADSFGFSIVSKKMMPFDPFYVSLLSEKYKNNSSNVISGFYHGFLSLLKSMGNVDKASSIIYVLKRKRG